MGRQRYGTNQVLEEEGTRLIRESLAGITSHEAKRDILTPWKEHDRRSREVYASSGTVDPAINRGMFNRDLNATAPHLNGRDVPFPPWRPRTSRPASSED
jgi:hypothetical protein